MQSKSLVRLIALFSIVSLFTVSFVGAIGEVTPTPDPEPVADPTPIPTEAPPVDDVDAEEVIRLLDEAITAFSDGNFELAGELADQAIALDDRNAEAYAIRGIIFARDQRYTLAIDDFTRAIDIIPYDWTFHTLRADTYVLLEEPNAAMRDYDRALELNPRHVDALANRASLNFSLGNSNTATVDSLLAEGVNQWRFSDYVGSIDTLSEAIEIDGGATSASAIGFYNRALAYSNLGDNNTAVEDYTSALAVDAQMHDSYLGRGISNVLLENLPQAGFDFLQRMQILETNSFTDSIELNGFLDVEMAYGNVYRIDFAGNAGDVVTISARDVDGVNVDPLIAFLDPTGEPIAGDDDLGGFLDSQIADFTLPATGTYTIVVSHANGGFDGRVRVSVSE